MPSLAQLRRTTRERARRSLSAGLRVVPDRAFVPLRTSFPTTSPDSPAHRLQRAALKAARYRGVPRGLDSFPLTDNPSIRITNADSFIVEWLYWFGERYGYEPTTILWWKAFAAEATRIVELGSNVGYYVLQGAKVAPRAQYIAIEPHPGCARVCRRNIALNDISNVEVIEAAVVAGDDASVVDLILPGGRDHYKEGPSTGFVGVNDVHHSAEDRSTYTSVSVPALPIAKALGSGTDLVKMDVEGQEHALLSAVLDLLVDEQPTMFVELLRDTNHLRNLIIDDLMPAGYQCFVPTRHALVPLSPSEISSVPLYETYGTRDVILASRPSPSLTIA